MDRPSEEELDMSFNQLIVVGVFERGSTRDRFQFTEWGKTATPEEIEEKARQMGITLT